ncbi:MAG: hypothetical protein IGR92_03760 [Leptolyngbyaceae cyanobacterium T60_A2020_046]|nr:hypothetical protein [Leptolyngbyaceae cyanobacterium T60_A2020_046]
MTITATALRRSQVYQAEVPLSDMARDLRAIAAIDQQAEAAIAHYQQKITRSGQIGCVAVLIAFVGSIVLGSVAAALVPLLLVPFGGVAAFFFYQAWKNGKQMAYEGRLDFANFRYGLVERLVPLLERDMRHSERVRIHLQLGPPDAREKFVGEMPHPRRRGWKIDHFCDRWLTLAGKLLDQTRFELHIHQRHEIRSGRNVNGKLRIRPRFKGFDLRLDITCPPEVRSHIAALPNLQGAVRLPRYVWLKAIAPTRRGLRLKVRVPGEIFPGYVPKSVQPVQAYANPLAVSPQVLADASTEIETFLYDTTVSMLLSAYQVVNLARVRARHAASSQ